MFVFRRFRLIAVLMVLALVASACGGDDTGGDDTTTTTTTASGGGGDGGAAATTTTTEAEPASGDSGSTWCDRIRQYQDSDDESPIDFNFFGLTPAELEAQFETNLEVYEEWARIAPSEIDDDVDTILGAFQVLFDRAKALEWNLVALADDPAFGAAFEDPAFEAAANNIDAYNRDVCGVDFQTISDPGTTPPPITGDESGDDAVSILLGSFGIPAGFVSADEIECMRGELGPEFEAKITPDYELTPEDTNLLLGAVAACGISFG